MILVVNKMSGTGCTTIAYNISKLLELPLYVQKTSYLYENEKTRENSNIKLIDKMNTIKKDCVIDYGSSFKLSSSNKKTFFGLIKKSKVAIVPFQIGSESIDKTIEMLVELRTINEEIKIVLVLNRLDARDSNTELLIKNDFILVIKEKVKNIEIKGNKLIQFDDDYFDKDVDKPKLISFLNADNIVLTYLRNSYALTGILPRSYNMTTGEYFLDLFKYEDEKYEKDIIDENRSYKKMEDELCLPHMDFKYFRYLFFLAINIFNKEKLEKEGKKVIKTEDEDSYYQEKDFVAFRNNSLRRFGQKFSKERYGKYIFKDERFHNFNVNSDALNYHSKLIKDLAFIVYESTSSFRDKLNQKEKFYLFDDLVDSEKKVDEPVDSEEEKRISKMWEEYEKSK